MKSCLVTGGAGFIGSHIADHLVESGYRVVIIDNESTGFRENVNPKAIYVLGDVTNLEDLQRVFSYGVDVVFHIAGQASTIRSFNDPLGDLDINVVGTINVVQKCLEHRVPHLLYASSMTAYGRPSELPIHEEMPCCPVSYYGVTKYAAERYVHATALRNDLDFPFHVTSFRMFNVYGERQRIDNPYQGVMGIFIGNVIRNEPIIIHGDGEQSRDFIYISDVVDAWIQAWHNPTAYEQVFNLGTGRRHSINQLADAILAAFDNSRENYPVQYAPLRPGDQRHMEADVAKAARILEWQPQVSFASGVDRTARWAIGSKSS
jgi:UDP-glucose 4-epimerase